MSLRAIAMLALLTATGLQLTLLSRATRSAGATAPIRAARPAVAVGNANTRFALPILAAALALLAFAGISAWLADAVFAAALAVHPFAGISARLALPVLAAALALLAFARIGRLALPVLANPVTAAGVHITG